LARLENLTERGYETQKQLGNALMELIIEKGYEKVSIKDLTERAGIDRTTFYLHFKDKDDLFTKSQIATINELVELRRTEAGPKPGVLLVFRHMSQNAKLYQAIFRTSGLVPGSASLEQYIANSIMPLLESELSRFGVSPPLHMPAIASYISGALRSLARWWLEAGMPQSPEEISELFIRLTTKGLLSLVETR